MKIDNWRFSRRPLFLYALTVLTIFKGYKKMSLFTCWKKIQVMIVSAIFIFNVGQKKVGGKKISVIDRETARRIILKQFIYSDCWYSPSFYALCLHSKKSSNYILIVIFKLLGKNWLWWRTVKPRFLGQVKMLKAVTKFQWNGISRGQCHPNYVH